MYGTERGIIGIRTNGIDFILLQWIKNTIIYFFKNISTSSNNLFQLEGVKTYCHKYMNAMYLKIPVIIIIIIHNPAHRLRSVCLVCSVQYIVYVSRTYTQNNYHIHTCIQYMPIGRQKFRVMQPEFLKLHNFFCGYILS